MWVTYSVVTIVLLWIIWFGAGVKLGLRQKSRAGSAQRPLWDGVRSPLKDVPTTDLRAMIGFSKTLTALPILDPRDGQWKVIQPSEEREDTTCTCHKCLETAAEAGAVVKVYDDYGIIDYFFAGGWERDPSRANRTRH